MTQKLFILGVGAQKAGTTWLHRELSKCPQINMGELKEYKCLRDNEQGLRQRLWRRRKDRKNLKIALGTTRKPSISDFLELSLDKKQALMLADNAYYFKYFESLVSNGVITRATGDISPHYSNLQKPTLLRAREQLEKHGFRVKVVFLMRDPVERIWSQIRMIRLRNTVQSICAYPSELEAIKACFKIDRVTRHTRYEETISNLEEVFVAKDIFYGFYETLFQSQSHQRLENFLDISLGVPDFNTKINQSPKTTLLPEDVAKAIAHEYRKTYLCIGKRFGAEALSLWPSAKYATNL